MKLAKVVGTMSSESNNLPEIRVFYIV